MRKMKYFNKKLFVGMGLCLGLVGCLFINRKNYVEAADPDQVMEQLNINYMECEDGGEILDEDVSETISQQVVDLEDKGQSYEVSDEVALDNGYFHHVIKEDGESVVAGVTVAGKSYVITIDSDKTISDEAVKEAIANLEQELA
ncbi:MAG: hypothetical protein Q4D45_09675 [Lachnospiraceae bacterium]|nr:hypothetical protein [Lachnospiraceae bacterium]